MAHTPVNPTAVDPALLHRRRKTLLPTIAWAGCSIATWFVALAATLAVAAEPASQADLAPPADAAPPAGLAAMLADESRDALVADVERLGDAARGSTIFHTRHLTCVQCHVVGAGVSPLGPNLASLPPGVPRERPKLVAHLVESILAPSAVIRPEYRGVTIVTDEAAQPEKQPIKSKPKPQPRRPALTLQRWPSKIKKS